MRKFLLLLLCGIAFAQQPQVTFTSPQALQGFNSKWTNGVGPGYWVYQSSAGLGITVSPGTVSSCYGTRTTYAGGSLTLTDNTTNYIYLKTSNSCAVTLDTTGPSFRDIPIGQYITLAGVVTTARDDRTWNSTNHSLGGVSAHTGTSYTILSKDYGQDVTFSNASTVTATLPTSLDTKFAFATQNLGAGTVNLTPSSGTINNVSSLPMTTGTGGWAFFDGTNWFAVMGGGGSSVGIKVNTVAIAGTNANFSDTTPAAGANFKNCSWQKDSSTPDTNISLECPAGTDTVLGFVKTITCPSNQWIWKFVSGTGVPACLQPAFSDLSGSATQTQIPLGSVNAQTASYTLVSGDSGKLVRMNCSSCTATLPAATPSTNWNVWIENIHSTDLTISRNGLTINGGTSNITLKQYGMVQVFSDNSNYNASVPLVAGTSITLTPAVNGLTIAATSPLNFADNETPSGTINGSNATFTLANAPSPAASLSCYLNGLEQRSGAGNDFTLSSLTITYLAAPLTGDTLVCSYRY